MAIVPNGVPAWVRTASHVDYGGDPNKRNYLSQGVIDALTDVGAEAVCRMAADLEAIVRSAPFAVITYTCDDTTPAAPTINSVYLMTGVNIVGYLGSAAPAGFPSAARNGNGDVTFTFSASYSDAYGVSGAFTPRCPLATVQSANAYNAPAVASGSTVRVRVFNDSGAAVTNQKVSLVVW